MRVANWNPGEITVEIEKRAMDRLAKAGELIASKARAMAPIGIDRPPYKSGKEWSGRKAGALRNTIRVTRLPGDPKQNIRVYAGSRAVYYARFVEFGTAKMGARPFLRPALNAVKASIKSIMENG